MYLALRERIDTPAPGELKWKMEDYNQRSISSDEGIVELQYGSTSRHGGVDALIPCRMNGDIDKDVSKSERR